MINTGDYFTMIGGPADRKRTAYMGYREVRIPTRIEAFLPWNEVLRQPSEVTAIRYDIYRLEPIKYKPGPDLCDTAFWVHESLSIDEAMKKIMEGYATIDEALK